MRDGNSRTPDQPAEPSAPADLTEENTTVDRPEPPTTVDLGPDPSSEPASVHVIVQGARTRIVLSGEVDADLAPDLQEATADAEATGLPIDIDAQHVTFMDSSGIAFLARIATRSTERVRVIRAPETVRFLLQVTRIGELLDLVDDPDADDAAAAGPDHGLPTIGPAGRRTPVGPTPDDVA